MVPIVRGCVMAPHIPTQSLRSLVGRIIYSSNGNDIECSVCGTDTNLVLINEYQKTQISTGMYLHKQY